MSIIVLMMPIITVMMGNLVFMIADQVEMLWQPNNVTFLKEPKKSRYTFAVSVNSRF